MQNADWRAFMYLVSSYLQYVVAQRVLQKAQLDSFLAAVEKRISARVEDLEGSGGLLGSADHSSCVTGVSELLVASRLLCCTLQ